ncbi:unnamed protein product, partial [Prorocentrum cordatum]
MADDEEQDSAARGLSCADVELMVSEFGPFFERPDWLQYKADLSKHPSKADQEPIRKYIKVCITIRSRIAPNCSLSKKATEHAVELISKDKWEFPGDTLVAYRCEVAAKLRALARHCASLWSRPKLPKWFAEYLKAEGYDESPDADSKYVYKYSEYKNNAVRIQTGTMAEIECEMIEGPDASGWCTAFWADGATWQFPKHLRVKQKASASKLPRITLQSESEGQIELFMRLAKDRDPDHRLVQIMKKTNTGETGKTAVVEQQTQASCGYWPSEDEATKAMKVILDKFQSGEITTKQDANKYKLDIIKGMEKRR